VSDVAGVMCVGILTLKGVNGWSVARPFLEAIYTWADLGLHTHFSLHLYYDPALVTTDPGPRTTGVIVLCLFIPISYFVFVPSASRASKTACLCHLVVR